MPSGASRWFSRLRGSSFFQYGLPLLIFCIGGSFALTQVTRIRYIFGRVRPMEKEELKRLGMYEDLPSLPEEYRRMKEQVDTSQWENIRAPRPWEPETMRQQGATKLGADSPGT